MHHVVLVTDPAQQAQLLCVRNPQPVIEQAFGQGEDCRIGADRESQRGCRNRREPRTLAKNPRPVAQIAPELIPPAKPQRGAHAFFVQRRRTERNAATARCFLGRMPCTHQVGRQILKMMGELSFHLCLETITLGYSAKPRARASNNSCNQ